MPIFCMIFLFPLPSNAFLDFVGEEAKKAIEVSAYADAVAELAAELAPDSDLEQGAIDMRKRYEALKLS